MLKWTASAQRLNEMQQQQEQDLNQDIGQRHRRRQQRRQRRATIANKENVPEDYGYTSTPRLRNSPLVLAPLSDILNITPEAVAPPAVAQRVQSVRYAATLPRFAEDYSPNGVLLPGQHLALRGLTPLDPFLGQPQRYMAAATGMRETKRKLDADLVETMEEQQKQTSVPAPASPVPASPAPVPRPTTPQPASSTQMGDQTLDRLIDAILDSACKADASAKKKPRRCRSTFNLRRRTLVKQQLDADGGRPAEVLSPSYAPGDDPASDLSFGTMPLVMTTPEPASPLVRIPHQVLVQLPTPQAKKLRLQDNTFCLETPVRSLKRSRVAREEAKESPLKRYKVDERNYFEVGLALPSSIYV
ncbi:hypothetical protein KR054_000384 [Drosophila jambulina]|nr:hypothetical protein KR054_000384 [Drosophila jambulina]